MSLFTKWWNKRKRFRDVFWHGSRKDEDVGAVLAELRQFCRADVSCVYIGKDGHVDTHMTTLLEGRREVFLRIVELLNLSDDQLLKMKEMAE